MYKIGGRPRNGQLASFSWGHIGQCDIGQPLEVEADAVGRTHFHRARGDAHRLGIVSDLLDVMAAIGASGRTPMTAHVQTYNY
jgi:hypothetical protein